MAVIVNLVAITCKRAVAIKQLLVETQIFIQERAMVAVGNEMRDALPCIAKINVRRTA